MLLKPKYYASRRIAVIAAQVKSAVIAGVLEGGVIGRRYAITLTITEGPYELEMVDLVNHHGAQ